MHSAYVIEMQKTSPLLFDPKRRIALEQRKLGIGQNDADFLVAEAASIMAERLEATNRDFERAVDMFSPFNTMTEMLKASAKTKSVTSMNYIPLRDDAPDAIQGVPEELSLAPNSVNLITSIFGLQRSNDLPGTLKQIEMALVPDGLFMAALPGDQTLKELRDSLLTAESMINGNATLRVDPFGEIRQLGGLLQRAGFALPVVDSEILTVRYSKLEKLITDLRAMGANSCLLGNKGFGPRGLFEKTEEIYKQRYSDADGKIQATFEIVFLSGWSPHASQQQPMKPGSAKNKLADFLGTIPDEK